MCTFHCFRLNNGSKRVLHWSRYQAGQEMQSLFCSMKVRLWGKRHRKCYWARLTAATAAIQTTRSLTSPGVRTEGAACPVDNLFHGIQLTRFPPFPSLRTIIAESSTGLHNCIDPFMDWGLLRMIRGFFPASHNYVANLQRKTTQDLWGF